MTEQSDATLLRQPHVLREYSLIADGHRGALIGPRGDVAWMCAPLWHSDAVFAALVGGDSEYVVRPWGVRFTWGGSYEEGTLIWRSRWITTDGIVECREALAYPADPHRAVLLRRVEALDGRARIHVSLSAQAGFGHDPVRDTAFHCGAWEFATGPLHVRWTGGTAARPHGHRLEATYDLACGDSHDFVLELSDRGLPGSVPDADTLWQQTQREWQLVVPAMTGTMADRDARHAYAVLRGLTDGPRGMVAAATTSLPERAEQGRNYDYRYCWIRDQCLTGQSVAAAGPHALLDDAVAFVAERLLDDGPGLAPAYAVGGGRVPDERPVDLPGYPGATVRVGNRVTGQFQLDALGEALLLFAAADRWDRLDAAHRRAVDVAVRAIEHRWGDPDAGIWELDDAPWAHSRLTCAAGLRAVAARAPRARADHWSALSDVLIADTTRRCRHRDGRWQRAPDDDRIDAALLLPGIRGVLPADDPRTDRTLDAVRTDLASDGYVYRFRHGRSPPHEDEGAFLLCGFVLALAEHRRGDVTAAARTFERNRAACGPPGLFTEEFDVVQRQLRGNVPQAFVHGLLLEAAHRLAGPWDGP